MPLHPSLSNVAPVSRRLGESVLAVMEQIDDVRRANASATATGKISHRTSILTAVPYEVWRAPYDYVFADPEDIARRAVL